MRQSKLLSDLPPAAALRVLHRIVNDLSNGIINVNDVKVAKQQVDYVKTLGNDLPDLSARTGNWEEVENWDESTFTAPNGGASAGAGSSSGTKAGSAAAAGTTGHTKKSRARKKPERRVLITRDCVLKVTNPKISEIEDELRSLHLRDHRHAIAVLFRVFLETSVDAFLTKNGVSLTVTVKGHTKDKSLQAKVTETISIMTAFGIDRRSLDGVAKGIHDRTNPLFIETLHAYVHNQFYSPKESDLTTAFDSARPFFEAIWK